MRRLKHFFAKPYRWAIIYSFVLVSFFVFALIDTFIIPKLMIVEESKENSLPETALQDSSEAIITDLSYKDKNIEITIQTIREYETTIYIADIQLFDASYLKTAFAENAFGRNIKEKTSGIAKKNNVIFAVNGDYYGFRDKGYVLRNGVLYRSVSRDNENVDDLVINNSGNLYIIQENEVSIESLNIDNISQIFSFGPALVENGQIIVSSASEVDQSKNSNPRTAIGQISPLHYIIIVSDGRTDESEGLSLLQLAQVFLDQGCSVAYNLDGGGSSTMYFNGTIINNPTDGRNDGEREISDIIYIGYE
jgi:exopolysaccharide biosynthesis protein